MNSELRIEYYYLPHGVTRQVSENGEINNEIWLDIGGTLSKGVFDHHELESSESEEKYKSTVRTLFCEEKLLENTVDEILNNLDKDNTVRIYTHIGPDLDALVSAYIVTQRLLLNKDEYESWINSEEVIRLIDYVDAIDQGKNKVVDSATLYCCFTYMYDDSVKKYWGITSEEAISERVREQAFVWLDQVIKTLKQSDRFNLFYSELPVLPDDEVFGLIKQALVREGNLAYQRDKRENRLKIKNIPLWTKSGEIENIKAAIWYDYPSSPGTSYVFARKEGAVVTFVPHQDYGNNGVRVSINPDIYDAVDRYSLLEVGQLYEQLEQISDIRLKQEKGYFRRDYSRSRGDGKSELFLSSPFNANCEPWYVSSEYDMVDAPNHGSMLTTRVMAEVLENITHIIKRTYMINMQLMPDQTITPKAEMLMDKDHTYNKWLNVVKKKVKESDEYKLIVTVVDSSLIAHDTSILDTYYASIAGQSYLEFDSSDVYRVDARHHLYVNDSYAVLFVAESEQGSKESTDGLLDFADLSKSNIVDVLSKIIEQNEKLKIFSKAVENFDDKKIKINEKNDELIKYLAKSHAYRDLNNPLKKAIYDFAYERLGISKNKDSVAESMQLISEYVKEKTYSNINVLSMITIPFILISTLFQIGLIRLPVLIDFGDYADWVSSVISWVSVLLITILITVMIFKIRKK